MNERIKQLAKLADSGYTGNSRDELGASLVGNDAIEKFADLIRADERESCAKWLEELREHQTNQSLLDLTDCAEAIRARMDNK